jgi:uncharacterized protein YycO
VATPEYVTKTMASAVVILSMSDGLLKTAYAYRLTTWSAMVTPGVIRKARTQMSTCRSRMSDVTDSLEKNCAKNVRNNTPNGERLRQITFRPS